MQRWIERGDLDRRGEGSEVGMMRRQDRKRLKGKVEGVNSISTMTSLSAVGDRHYLALGDWE